MKGREINWSPEKKISRKREWNKRKMKKNIIKISKKKKKKRKHTGKRNRKKRKPNLPDQSKFKKKCLNYKSKSDE